MKDSSEITYWLDGDNILTVPTTEVPKMGEKIHIDTRMDEDWHDARFPNRKLFNKGVRGNFVVSDVRRYYKSYDYVHKETFRETAYELPAQRTVETFEVHLETFND
jgi:hypothetical protein